MTTDAQVGEVPRQVEAVPIRVAVVDLDMPFGSMIAFIIKWTLASIPAILMLLVLGFVLSAAFAGVLAGLLQGLR